jgi:hypothetical protein
MRFGTIGAKHTSTDCRANKIAPLRILAGTQRGNKHESEPQYTTMSDLPPTVAAIGQMHFEGNIIPHTWYKAITFPNGKADVNAILILAEIVYWYRPTVERDEATGEIINIRKKFKADKLQRSYQSFGDQFGLTRRQCEDAIARLVAQGFITKETRTVDTAAGKIGNVLFVEPVPAAIQRISSYDETYKDIRSNVEAYAPHGMTYTKTTRAKSTAKRNVRPPSGRKGKTADGKYSDPPSEEPKRKYSGYN